MAKNKFGIQFEGFKELMAELDAVSGDLKGVTEKALQASHKIVTPALNADMQKHRRSGATAKSIIENDHVNWDGMTASIDIGFDLKDGGLASIFLMYGTPRMKKDTQLYNDIYGSATRKKIAEVQEKIIHDAIMEKLGG